MRPPPEAFFDGATVPEWEAIQRPVLILDGELTYLRRPWETAYKNTAAGVPVAQIVEAEADASMTAVEGSSSAVLRWQKLSAGARGRLAVAVGDLADAAHGCPLTRDLV
ncbi:hypothetical protein ACJ6WD_17770 [Streptomyces sp. VTCC 41912]|uniref:hypothetical protein n=1 Tax=Streptomyces sp. VTCC 41912 TaxID=3383243 RepID=UPI003896B423